MQRIEFKDRIQEWKRSKKKTTHPVCHSEDKWWHRINDKEFCSDCGMNLQSNYVPEFGGAKAAAELMRRAAVNSFMVERSLDL